MSEADGWGGRRPSPPGDLSALVGRLDDHTRRLDDLATGAPLQSASISSGGLVIRDGGDVTIDGGDLRIVSDTGRFEAMHPDGTPAAIFGPLWLVADPDTTESRGLLVQSTAADNNRDIFRAKYVLATGEKAVYVGQSTDSGNIDWFSIWSDTFYASTTDIDLNATDTVYIRATAGFAQLEGSTGAAVYSPQQVQINSGVSQVFIQHGTTATGANCVITTGGLIQRSTSSLRYKANVEDLDIDPAAVLGMRPVTFQDVGELEADPTTTKRYPGFIAEEIAELGLEAFVVRDDEGRPDALQYDRIVAAQQVVIRDHEARLATQAGLIANLTARLEALEAS